jgi:hypothetical protein
MTFSVKVNRSVGQITAIRLWLKFLVYFIASVLYTELGNIDSTWPPNVWSFNTHVNDGFVIE